MGFLVVPRVAADRLSVGLRAYYTESTVSAGAYAEHPASRSMPPSGFICHSIKGRDQDLLRQISREFRCCLLFYWAAVSSTLLLKRIRWACCRKCRSSPRGGRGAKRSGHELLKLRIDAPRVLYFPSLLDLARAPPPPRAAGPASRSPFRPRALRARKLHKLTTTYSSALTGPLLRLCPVIECGGAGWRRGLRSWSGARLFGPTVFSRWGMLSVFDGCSKS